METNIEFQNTLAVYGNIFQSKCIAALVSDRSFLERIVDILSPEYWETDAHKWVVKIITNYFIKYKELPTLEVFRMEWQSISDNQEVLRAAVLEEIKKAYFHIKDTDVQYVKEQFLTFCKQMKLKTAIWRSVEHLKKGDYEAIKHEIDEVMRAGLERNLGHEYLVDVDKRMSLMACTCVKTGWDLIDQRLDGGLGNGELGFIIGPGGSGKCVGPNTIIEIQYTEIGVPVDGNSGKEYVIWIKPFEKYDVGFDLGVLYGWQIDNIFFEVEKLAYRLQEQEKIHKK